MANLDSLALSAALDGVLLVDKPLNISTHDVVKAVKQHFNLVKIGHGGTLDPNATGLLVLLLGHATRQAADIMGRNRAYEARIRLGRATNTGDADGETVAEKPFADITREKVDAAVRRAFLGDMFQKPPAFSVIKMPAHSTYDIVPTDEKDRTDRLVHLFRMPVSAFEPPIVAFDILCTKGMCVRALADDLGRELGCGASLETLRRTACGAFSVSDAIGFMDVLKLDASAFRARVRPLGTLGLDGGTGGR
jgi:tRNA pseudouridine55 synthase